MKLSNHQITILIEALQGQIDMLEDCRADTADPVFYKSTCKRIIQTEEVLEIVQDEYLQQIKDKK